MQSSKIILTAAPLFVLQVCAPLSFAADCDAERLAFIDSAVANAAAVSKKALDDLPTTPSDNRPNYVAYFGKFEQSRKNKVSGILSAVISTANVASKDYSCFEDNESRCSGTDTHAWVTPDQPYKVAFCRRFFAAAGYQQSRIIVHEFTHFSINGGTDAKATSANGHHCKTEESCKLLATNSPDLAVVAAYAYQWYVTNY